LPGGGGCAWVAPFKVKAHYKIPCSSCWIVWHNNLRILALQ
jgi:hypothetical protein